MTRKLRVKAPSSQLVDAYTAEIAKAYGIKGSFASEPLDQADGSETVSDI